jgi:Uma2 family endonuclease
MVLRYARREFAYEGAIVIPPTVRDLNSFRAWVKSDDFPEKLRVAYLAGTIWMDPYMEQVYTHGRLKGAVNAVLYALVEAENLGQYFPDGILISDGTADLSNEPDGTFVTFEALRSGHVRRIKGKSHGTVELYGGPDMTLEVVSDSSVKKDNVNLFSLYWKAGVREYWLIDARGDELRFDIYRRGPKGFLATRRAAGGWLKSTVFARSFRLAQSTDDVGDPRYTLEVRP